MRAAYRAESALQAQAQLETLAGELDRTHPGAAASLREGLPETLTVLRLVLQPDLEATGAGRVVAAAGSGLVLSSPV